MAEALSESLQESILAVLAFDVKHGAVIAAQVQPENFSGLYRDVAQAVLAYRRKYQKPPGPTHLEHVFSSAQLDPSKRETHALRRVLVNLSAQAEGLNSEYVAGRTQDFIRTQKLGAALLQANERYVQGGDGVAGEVEGILHEALRFRQDTFDAGTFLSDVRKSSIFAPKEDAPVLLNIPELDRYGVGPTAKRMLLYIAPKNSGKSWFCVHCGRQALVQKGKVLHVSLEMGEPEVLDRYYQSFFSAATRSDRYPRAHLEFDELERLTGIKLRQHKPRLDFSDPSFAKVLTKKVGNWGSRFKRLVIKEFPSGSLTVTQLRAYLDYLELVHKFVPTTLIVDYPDLFHLRVSDFRLALGRVFVDLRGLATERNMALVVPTQSGRAGIGATKVSSTNVSEDISKVFTADTVLTFSQTDVEAKLGLGRLRVDHARQAPKGMTVLLSQAYPVGQYVVESAALSQNYWDQLSAFGEDGGPPVDDFDED